MYHELNLYADRKPAKCARIVGDVLGKFHPHSDVAIYDALVRMAQDFVVRMPLVDGQGNFGSVGGDSPASIRYTEARLTALAEQLLAELRQQTVAMRPNYDGTQQEPVVLPAQFPNLLVNGTAGIAVGMATNIPPHNLGDLCRACVLLIENKDASTANLLDEVKGPDFPLGGKIVTDRRTLRKIYEDGQAASRCKPSGRSRKRLASARSSSCPSPTASTRRRWKPTSASTSTRASCRRRSMSTTSRTRRKACASRSPSRRTPTRTS
jgi:DNA gyrase subunit A